MGKLIFIPGMRPGTVSGAAGASTPRTVERLVAGSAYRGRATPKNLVPYEEPRRDATAIKRKELERKQDVADAYHFHRDSPVTAKEKLRETYAAAAEVPV